MIGPVARWHDGRARDADDRPVTEPAASGRDRRAADPEDGAP
jgi:hypothetical protein